MPTFRTLSAQEIHELIARRRASGGVDLALYRGWVESAQLGAHGWGQIDLEPTDNVRAIKRRTTLAGKELGKVVKWNRRSDDRTLIFRVFDRRAAPIAKRRAGRAKPGR